jgi:DNA-binding transcriptional ArsR family regulator
MPDSDPSPQTPAVQTQLALEDVLPAIGDPTRWRILAELSAGEPLMVTELGQRLGRSADLISKHLATLRRAGLVVSGRGRLYQIPPQYLTAPHTVDIGYCLLRLDR